MKKRSAFLFFIFTSINCVFGAVKIPKKYIFHTQFNDLCMIAPMLNLPLVEQLEKKDYDIKKLSAYTRREWFVLNFRPLYIWHQAFHDAVNVEGKKKQNLVAFLNEAIARGPVMPNYLNVKLEFAFHGISGAMQIGTMPYFFSHYQALIDKKIYLFNWRFLRYAVFDFVEMCPDLGLYVPVVLDEDEKYIT